MKDFHSRDLRQRRKDWDKEKAEHPDAAVPKEEVPIPCIQKGCGKPSGHKGRHTDGTLPGHVKEAPPTDTAQPVAWRYRFKRLSGKWGPKENWLYLTDAPEKNDLWEVQPLYAHPEDAPGGPSPYVALRQRLRTALWRDDFWPNNPGVGDDEIIEAVNRLMHERLTRLKGEK